MPLYDGCISAIQNGLSGITFCDHLDIDFPNPKYLFTFDFAQRTSAINKLKEDFSGKLKIFKGIEIGFQPHIAVKLQNIIDQNDFDLVINSVHTIDDIDLANPFFFYAGKTKDQVYQQYLEAIYNSITQFDAFDVVGHLGYVRRYMNDDCKAMPYFDYSDIIQAILKTIIEKGKGLEINTSGFYRKNLGSPIPDFDIIKEYHSLGGEIITLGSDAHHPEFIGNNFRKTVEQLKQIGFTRYCYFEGRKPIFVSF
jgi:histidinol-phosphatase (PHP family)